MRRLRPDVRVDVGFEDRTLFGSPVGHRPDENVQRVYAPVLRHVENHGFEGLVDAGPALLTHVVESEAFSEVAELTRSDWRVHDHILYPEVAAAPPNALSFAPAGGSGGLGGRFDLGDWPHLHELVSALSVDGVDPARASARTAGLVAALERSGLLEDAVSTPDPEIASSDLTFVGHNTVVVRSATASVVVDPWFAPADPADLPGYQPLQLRDVGRVDAVVITHSHPDHFAPSTLLQFPPATRIIVPRMERETILTVAMAQRCRQLGFTDVVELDWWESVRVGDIEVVALPFHGEQATDCEQLHPAIRNHGNTYFIRTPSFSAAFLADSGRDGNGEVRAVAGRARLEVGSPDVVFTGYRGWLTYPVQLLYTSVARFVLFVPRHLWGVRQRLMTTADEAIDVAEAWGARTVVPYADGGAPWYWRMGLGPRLDEEVHEANGFDPLPERVLAAARNRTEMPCGLLGSPVRVALMRPGDSMRNVSSDPAIVRVPGHEWPFSEQFSTADLAGMLG